MQNRDNDGMPAQNERAKNAGVDMEREHVPPLRGLVGEDGGVSAEREPRTKPPEDRPSGASMEREHAARKEADKFDGRVHRRPAGDSVDPVGLGAQGMAAVDRAERIATATEERQSGSFGGKTAEQRAKEDVRSVVVPTKGRIVRVYHPDFPPNGQPGIVCKAWKGSDEAFSPVYVNVAVFDEYGSHVGGMTSIPDEQYAKVNGFNMGWAWPPRDE